MLIHIVVVGPIETNCYIVEDEKSREAMVIDPGDEPRKILKFLEEHQLKPRCLVITHGHYDHIGANRELKEKTGAPILMHKNDVFGLKVVDSPPADRHLEEGDEIKNGDISLRVIHTPGHSPGGICLYCEKEKVLFSGDTLFADTYGRTDLPYSSEEEMAKSLQKLLKLPPDTKVYPGHGQSTTIGDEQKLLAEL